MFLQFHVYFAYEEENERKNTVGVLGQRQNSFKRTDEKQQWFLLNILKTEKLANNTFCSLIIL